MYHLACRFALILVPLSLSLGQAALPDPGAASPRPGVLIIGIDGCRPDALLDADTPNIDELTEHGAYSYNAQTGDITVSGPGWTSMLTGVWRDKHGVRDNSFEGARLGAYPHFFVRLCEVHPEAFTASIAHWEPIHSRIVAGADHSAGGLSDAEVAAEAASLLREEDPDVLFLHFDDVDITGHRAGFSPAVREYLAAIEVTDRHIGTVLEALRARPTYVDEDWLILLSTDHGGSGTSHGQDIPAHRTIFFIASGPSAERGEITGEVYVVDVAATALAHLGVQIDPEWNWDGRAVGLREHEPATWGTALKRLPET